MATKTQHSQVNNYFKTVSKARKKPCGGNHSNGSGRKSVAENQRTSSPEASLFSGGEVPVCRFSCLTHVRMARIQGLA